MVLAMSIFGSVGIIAPYTHLKAFELVFVRCVSGTFFLALAWLVSGRYRHETWNLRDIGFVVLCGLALVLNWIFLFRAFELMPVTLAVSIYYLAPVFVLLLGVPIFGERFSIWSLLSVFFCFSGSSLVAGLQHGFNLQELLSSGVVWALLAAIFYAFLTLLGKGVKALSPYAVACLQTLLGAILLPAFVHFGAFSALSTSNWLAVILMGAIHTGLVYFLFFGSIRTLPARTISVLVYLDPITAVVLDVSLNGFRPALTQFAGIALLGLGLALTGLATKQSQQKNLSGLEQSPG
jgi:drug/metabolite transporter (DMT)-like permease